jgi:MFS transporter, AAHS family, 3-hydroxyphenylpropionic acid transporter
LTIDVSIPRAPAGAPGRTHARSTLVLCALAALLEGFDNQSMGVAAPRLALEFALSSGQKGFVFSAATLGLFVGAACGGRAADLFGRKRTLSVSLLLFGLCSLLTATAAGAGTLILARLLTGLGLGGAMPNFIALSSEAAHPARRLSSVTIVMAGMPFGGAVAALIALGDRWGWGWRSIFYVGGIAPILLSLVMWRALRDSSPAATSASHPRVDSVPTVLFGADRAATTLLLWGGFFFTQLVLLLMLNWLPTLMVGLGFTRTQASWASVCFNISGALGAILLGRLHAGARRRMWVVLTYIGMAVALAAVPAVGGAFPLAALACGLAGIFIVGAQLILFALAPLYYRTAIRCTGVGAAVAVGRFGSVIGPLYASALLAGGGGSASVLIGILPFVAIGGAAALGLTWRQQCSD